ncbi:hypothetical protein [Streptomyces sp. NPDC059063]
MVKKAPRTTSHKGINRDKAKPAVVPNPDGNRAERRKAKKEDKKK